MSDRYTRIPGEADGDDDQWMRSLGSSSDDEVDALLRGMASPATDPLRDLVLRLRTDAARHPAPVMSEALRQQAATGLTPVGDGGRTRRRLLLGVAVGALAGASTLGVAAAQEVLPEPLQDATAAVAGVVGIDLPRSDARPAEERDDHDPTTTPSTDPSTSGATGGPSSTGSAGGQGNGEADDPGTGKPDDPGTSTVGGPGTSKPDDPGTGKPDDPGARKPDDPGTRKPDDPGTGQTDGQETGDINGQAADH